MYNARITFKQFETYSNFLSSQGLLARKSQEYVATQRGYQFVQAFGQLQSTLDGVPSGILTKGFLLKRGTEQDRNQKHRSEYVNASQW